MQSYNDLKKKCDAYHINKDPENLYELELSIININRKKYDYVKLLKDTDISNLVIKSMPNADALSYNYQKNIEILIKSLNVEQKDSGFGEIYRMFFNNSVKYIQTNYYMLNTSTTKTSDGNDEIFMIKSPKNMWVYDDILYDTVHESLIGLYMNEIRKYLPNFVYTYDVAPCDFMRTNLSEEIVDFCGPNNNNNYYIITEKINGKTLRDLLSGVDKFDSGDFIDILLQISNALGIANVLYGFTHYDLHYENVMVITNNGIRIPLYDIYDNNSIIGYIEPKYIPVIIDYGYSCVNEKNIGKFGMYNLDYNISPHINPMYDISRLIYTLHDENIPDNIKKIINTISEGFFGVDSQKLSEYYVTTPYEKSKSNRDFMYFLSNVFSIKTVDSPQKTVVDYTVHKNSTNKSLASDYLCMLHGEKQENSSHFFYIEGLKRKIISIPTSNIDQFNILLKYVKKFHESVFIYYMIKKLENAADHGFNKLCIQKLTDLKTVCNHLVKSINDQESTDNDTYIYIIESYINRIKPMLE